MFSLESNIRCEWTSNFYYVCYCDVMYRDEQKTITLNGTSCLLKDECQTNNGGCAQLCEDTRDGFNCKCYEPDPDNPDTRGWTEPVWTLSENGFDCNDVDECKNATFVDLICPSPGKCVNTPGFYKCISSVAISKNGALPGN